MDSKYSEFFDALPKHALLPIVRLVPSKFSEITSDLLAYVFIQQGVIKKVILDNLKECANKVIKQQLTPVNDSDESVTDVLNMNISDECKILLDSYLFFKARYEPSVSSQILTSYISYIMISDDRLSCHKFFKDCLYVKEYNTVINSLYSQLSDFIGNARSDVLIDYGEYLTDPLIYKHYDYFGRGAIVSECIDSLCRLNKSNVLLVGNAGVGKTSIAYEVCNVISSDECPPQLKNCNVFMLSLGKLMGGTTFRGDLEKRLETVIDELRENKNIILFIDEMQSFVSKDSDSRTIQNALKSYLSDCSKMIGCTTEDEYKIIESDRAFERRFTKIVVPEMTPNETVEILQKKKSKYESFHNLSIHDDLLDYIVSECDLRIKNRYFPDKAFDILDKSCVLCVRAGKQELERSYIDSSVSQFCNTRNKIDIEHVNSSEKSVKSVILGQDEIIEKTFNYFRRYALGVHDLHKPIASLLFVGPTGTGKTELCKQLAHSFFSDESFIRYDMSEFMESHSIAKIIGSPPGYVGYDKGGSLTEQIKHNPFSIILFDEIEKAHKDVVNVLLQIMDDGRLTDSFGTTVDFRNCVIVMTSNIGCKEYLNKNTLGFSDSGRDKTIIRNGINSFFSPEFLNRLDDILYFNEISKDVYSRIFDNLLDMFIKRYESSGIEVKLDKSSILNLKDVCFDEKSGVRFVKNKIAHLIEPEIFKQIGSNGNGKKSVKLSNYNFKAVDRK